ncbi:MAG: DNA-binding protein [Chloroflexi bacterium]|nr:DNA-binding protein [Chloroflexota bacterium]
MVTITVSLPERKAVELKEMASTLGVTVEDLVRLGVEDLLTQPKEDFDKALTYVLSKNKELYERLA